MLWKLMHCHMQSSSSDDEDWLAAPVAVPGCIPEAADEPEPEDRLNLDGHVQPQQREEHQWLAPLPFASAEQPMPTVPLLNWVNPAAIKSYFMSKMATQAQEALSESDKNIGLCLTPEFVYQKGNLWLQEMQCAKMLSKQRMHVDRTMNVNTMKCTHACV